MANGNGAKAKRRLAKESSAVLEAERVRAEKAWGEAEPEKTVILNSLNELVVFQDLEHQVLWANKVASELVGLPSEDLVGRYCYDLWGRGGKVCYGCPIDKARKTGKPQAEEMTTPDGRVWLVKGYPILDASGDVTGLVEMAVDITERKRVAEELQEQKNKLQSVVGAMEDGLTVQDRDFNIIYQNEPLKQDYGDRLGEKCYRAYEGRDTICEDCPVQKAFNDGKSHTAEREVVLPSGEVTFGEIKASPVRDANGRIVSCLEIIRNIAERRRTEEALRESEAKYRALAEGVPIGIYFNDFSGKLLYGNDRAAEIIGYKHKELIGKNLFKLKLLDAKGMAKGLKLLALNKMGKATGPDEFVLNRKNGTECVVEITTRITTVGDRKMVLGMVEDITERKQAEQRLQESEEKFSKAFRSSADAICITSLRDNRFIEINEAFTRFTGYTREETIGHSSVALDLWAKEEDLERWQNALQEKGKVYNAEFHSRMKSGEIRIGLASAETINIGGEPCRITVIADITERKKSEEALADELTRRRMLVDQSRDGIVILDDNGKVYEANQRFADMLGYTYEEAQELSVWDWEYLFPREQVAEMIRTVDETGDHFETRHRRKDGTTFDVEISTNGTVCAGQKLIFCVCRDITERKQSEKALVEAEEKYKKLVEANSDLIWEVDTEGWYTFVSPRIKDLLGYEVKEVVGKKRTLDFSPKKEARKWLKRFKKINAKRAAFSGFEILHHHKNGNPVIFEISGIPFFDGAGNFTGYVGVNKDITERKQVTEALKENQEFSTGLLENTPNPESVINPDTSIRYVNPAFEKLTGYKLAEIAGMKAPYPWWPKKESKVMTQTLKKAMQTGGKKSEHVFRKKNGEPLWVMLNSAPVIHRNKVLYFLINWIDVTDRKRAEEERAELEQKAHLASRLASVGEMASGIAHEINNPLTAVIGFAQLLMDNDLPDEIKEDLTIIHKEAQRAAGVARNLLTFARKHAPSKQLTNINSIIEGVLTLRAYEQNVSNIQIKTRLASNLPEVMADYSQLQQVFINIILNAEAAMLEANNGGTLTITTRRFNHSVRASFADDGPGIARENLNRIFDPFFTTKEVGKGTGLGLSVCHGIIAEHGGKIYARSKPGRGATFIVELPIVTQESAEESSEAD
jgi:PAS domain S-box-containing protein